MDWLLATPQIQSAFSSLGSLEGDIYVVSPNALAILEEINYKLTYEDQTLRTFRRAIGFGQNVRSDLIPLLENANDDAVLDSVIRILVNLTVPVECLFSVDVMNRTEVGRHTIYELNKLLYTSKEAFTDAKSTKSIVEFMKHILESDSKLSAQRCDQINNCLLLLRNILHIPEHNGTMLVSAVHSSAVNGGISMQNTILWNLFIQSIDKLLIYLMTCPHRAFWGVTMVQLIALMYKDQHVSTLQKLLNMWFEASLSDSSEDNESNTSPPKQGSGDSSPMLTSDPTSDSSDNGSGGCKNESSEDRRQALREETDATLQEVSRKGQEYQNYLLRTTNIAQDHNTDIKDEMIDCERPCTSAQAAAALATIAAIASIVTGNVNNTMKTANAMEAGEDEEGALSDVTVIDPVTPYESSENPINEIITQTNQQPAESANTSDSVHITDPDIDTFKPPPPLSLLSPKTSASAKSQPKMGKTSTAPSVSDTKEMCDAELTDSSIKHCQKVPHAGQINLTKGKCCPQKRECPSSQSELSDCGYGTQVENQESISTSSNDDEIPQNKPHQKPPCSSKQRNKQRPVLSATDKKELRRKKLVKRSKSSLINMKGLVQHAPTDEDISKILKEFTVDFLLKGYGYLVSELHTQLLTNIKVPIDTSHFFWLVTYFLKFAAQLELDMEHISTILTYDVISYLTYEGVMLCEQLELNSRQEGSDLKPYLRRMHLVVTAIREFLQAIETYKKVTHLSEKDQENLHHLLVQISSTEDLRYLFVLLLRRFNPNLHTKQYLQDVVVTNHILLLILDNVAESDSNVNIKLTEHISQFATPEIMSYYGLLLEDFNNNGEFVNDCIFTMMHHIGGDLGHIGTLFQPVILKTYSRIWEADYDLCDDWSDLIEYVIHKFMNTPPKSPLTLPSTSLTELTKEHNLENTVCSWTQEEMDTLYWYYVQSKKNNDVVGKIVTLFNNNGNRQKSRISIIQQLLQQDIITLIEYDDLMKFEDAEYQRTLLTTPTSSTTESGIDLKNSTSIGKPSDDIQILRDLIIKEKKEKHLVWLQKILLECCYIKMILKTNLHAMNRNDLEYSMEPVAYHCILKNKSIPVVQWNNEQATTMLYQPFVLLLHKLGFQLPADAGSVFARIPDYWTSDTMFNLAKKLGPLDKLLIKFDVTQLDKGADAEVDVSSRCHYHTIETRTSSTSAESLESDTINEVQELTDDNIESSNAIENDIKPEKTNTSDVFAVPKAKNSNSLIRFTPEPSYAPNWLQLVMRSKCNLNVIPKPIFATPTSLSNDADVCMSSNNALPTFMSAATTATNQPITMTALTPTTTTSATITASTDPLHLMAVAVSAATGAEATTQQPTSLRSSTSINNIIGYMQTEPQNVNRQSHCHSHSHSSSSNSNDNGNSNSNSSSGIRSGSGGDGASSGYCSGNPVNSNCGNNNNTKSKNCNIRCGNSSSLHISNNNNNTNNSNNTNNNIGNNSNNNYNALATATTAAMAALFSEQQQDQQQFGIDDTAKKPFERNDSNSSGYYTRSICGNLESEYSAMVASVYENEIANSDSASVASDLTRMYVSDEDDRHEFRVSHFN